MSRREDGENRERPFRLHRFLYEVEISEVFEGEVMAKDANEARDKAEKAALKDAGGHGQAVATYVESADLH